MGSNLYFWQVIDLFVKNNDLTPVTPIVSSVYLFLDKANYLGRVRGSSLAI